MSKKISTIEKLRTLSAEINIHVNGRKKIFTQLENIYYLVDKPRINKEIIKDELQSLMLSINIIE